MLYSAPCGKRVGKKRLDVHVGTIRLIVSFWLSAAHVLVMVPFPLPVPLSLVASTGPGEYIHLCSYTVFVQLKICTDCVFVYLFPALPGKVCVPLEYKEAWWLHAQVEGVSLGHN